VASGGSADDVSDGLNRRDLDVALRQWVELNVDSLSAAGPGNVDQLEKVGRLMMNIGSRLEAGDSAENDQMALKRRVEAVWKLRRVCCHSNNNTDTTDNTYRWANWRLCVLMHQVHIGLAPSYLRECVTASADVTSRPRLLSTISQRYERAHTRLKFGERSFSCAGPRAWNSLQSSLQELTDIKTFKRKLKTFLFQQAYH